MTIRKALGRVWRANKSMAGDGASRPLPERSGVLQVDGAGLAALVLLEIVGHALLLIERAHAGLLDRADVNEGVVAAALGRDEAEALVGIEEFYGADRHV